MATHRRTARGARPDEAPMVTCDCCGDGNRAGFMLLHDRYAICPHCVDFVRDFDKADKKAQSLDVDYARSCREVRKETLRIDGTYSASSVTVRRYFGMNAGAPAPASDAGENLVRGQEGR